MKPSRKWWLVLICAALAPALALPPAADAGHDGEERVLYGMAHLSRTGPNLLYSIDPGTGEAALIGSTGTSVLRISAMALSDDGVMYAVGVRNDAAETHVLVTIDLETAEPTEIGPTGLEDFIGVFPQRRVMSDLSFSKHGELYAYAFPGGGLATIDLATGTATQRIEPGFPGTGFFNGGGLAFSRLGVLLHGGDSGDQPGEGSAALQVLDPDDSEVLFERPLHFPEGFGLDPRPNTMDFHPRTGRLYSLFKANFMEQETYFGRIFPVLGIAWVIGPTADGMAALAWGPDPDDD